MKQLSKLQDVAKDVLPDLFENILGQVQATGHKSHAEWTEEQVLEMWEARDRTKRRTKTIEHIADTLELSRFNVGEFIQEYEENNDNV